MLCLTAKNAVKDRWGTTDGQNERARGREDAVFYENEGYSLMHVENGDRFATTSEPIIKVIEICVVAVLRSLPNVALLPCS